MTHAAGTWTFETSQYLHVDRRQRRKPVSRWPNEALLDMYWLLVSSCVKEIMYMPPKFCLPRELVL